MITDQEIALSCIELAAEEYRVPVRHIISKKRAPNVAQARRAAMFDTRMNTNLTLREIGQCFGGKSAWCVSNAITQFGGTNKQ